MSRLKKIPNVETLLAKEQPRQTATDHRAILGVLSARYKIPIRTL